MQNYSEWRAMFKRLREHGGYQTQQELVDAIAACPLKDGGTLVLTKHTISRYENHDARVPRRRERHLELIEAFVELELLDSFEEADRWLNLAGLPLLSEQERAYIWGDKIGEQPVEEKSEAKASKGAVESKPAIERQSDWSELLLDPFLVAVVAVFVGSFLFIASWLIGVHSIRFDNHNVGYFFTPHWIWVYSLIAPATLYFVLLTLRSAHRATRSLVEQQMLLDSSYQPVAEHTAMQGWRRAIRKYTLVWGLVAVALALFFLIVRWPVSSLIPLTDSSFDLSTLDGFEVDWAVGGLLKEDVNRVANALFSLVVTLYQQVHIAAAIYVLFIIAALGRFFWWLEENKITIIPNIVDSSHYRGFEAFYDLLENSRLSFLATALALYLIFLYDIYIHYEPAAYLDIYDFAFSREFLAELRRFHSPEDNFARYFSFFCATLICVSLILLPNFILYKTINRSKRATAKLITEGKVDSLELWNLNTGEALQRIEQRSHSLHFVNYVYALLLLGSLFYPLLSSLLLVTFVAHKMMSHSRFQSNQSVSVQ